MNIREMKLETLRRRVAKELEPITPVVALKIERNDLSTEEVYNGVLFDLKDFQSCVVGWAYDGTDTYTFLAEDTKGQCKKCEIFARDIVTPQYNKKTWEIIKEPTREFLLRTRKFIKHFNRVHREQ